jgi:hypothetical protein
VTDGRCGARSAAADAGRAAPGGTAGPWLGRALDGCCIASHAWPLIGAAPLNPFVLTLRRPKIRQSALRLLAGGPALQHAPAMEIAPAPARPARRPTWSRPVLRAAAVLAKAVPRSLAGWFAVCWGLFLAAALVAGASLVSLYRDGTTERLRRAEAAIARGCDTIAERYCFVTAGSTHIAWTEPETERALTAAALLALRDLPGVEGGLWRGGVGPLAYAYPTYEGAEPKTDVPAAELPRIRVVDDTNAPKS